MLKRVKSIIRPNGFVRPEVLRSPSITRSTIRDPARIVLETSRYGAINPMLKPSEGSQGSMTVSTMPDRAKTIAMMIGRLTALFG